MQQQEQNLKAIVIGEITKQTGFLSPLRVMRTELTQGEIQLQIKQWEIQAACEADERKRAAEHEANE